MNPVPISGCRCRIATYLLLTLIALRGPAASPATLASSAAGQATSDASFPDKRTAAVEALKQVDELLQTTHQITGLPIRHPVKNDIASREQIHLYIQQQLEETATSEQLRVQEVALKKFGLLPADFELGTFLVILLSELATAYYDHRKKHFYIADWTPPARSAPGHDP